MMILKDIGNGIIHLDGDNLLARIVQTPNMHTNAGRMSCRVVLSTQDEDRSGDVVVTKGIYLDDHKKNPIALLNHNKNAPVGRFEDRAGNYTVRLRTPTELVGEIFFNQSSQFAQDVFAAVEKKVFSAVSIGFMPVDGKVEKNHSGRGRIYHASRMVEGSVLTIGDNQHAIIEAVEKGFHGKQICKELKAMLTPMIEPRPPVVVSGFAGEVVIDGRRYVAADSEPVTKGMDKPKRGCVMAPISGTAAQAILNAGKSIADEDLAEDGRETDPHVTVRYGFMPAVEAADVERIARPYGPIGFTLGHTAVFAGPEHDVVYYTVNPNKSDGLVPSSPVPGVPTAVYPSSDRALWELNEALADLPHEDTHPTYIAHACIAYVKPGLGEKYAKMIGYPRSGIGCFVTELVYSSAGKERSIIPLVGTKSLKAKLNTSANPATVERQPAPTIHKTYLQRMRTKAMNPEDEDTLQGAAAPVNDTLPPDPNAEPAPEDADLDGMTDEMKPFAQMCHTAHEQLLQIIQGLEVALSDTEHPGAAKMAEKVKAAVGKAMASVTAAFSDYKESHPDQPDIPGAEAPPEGLGADEEDDIPDDEETDDDDLDLDNADGEQDEADDEPTKEKAWAGYAVKCFQGYWDYIHTKAFAGDKPAMDEAARLLAEVARDKQQPMPRRKQAQVIAKKLRGGLVMKEVDWSGIDLSSLRTQVAAVVS